MGKSGRPSLNPTLNPSPPSDGGEGFHSAMPQPLDALASVRRRRGIKGEEALPVTHGYATPEDRQIAPRWPFHRRQLQTTVRSTDRSNSSGFQPNSPRAISHVPGQIG